MQATASVPITRDLVLLGGGHTHALVLRKWAMDPLAGVQVTLVNPDVKAPYTGMLPGFVAGHYGRDELDIDLVRLARRAGARLIVDRAVGIDTERKRVHLADRPDIVYDTLSIDVGISSRVPVSEHDHPVIIPAKPLGPFADKWSTLIERSTSEGPPAKVAILGGGVAGVELALAMAHRLQAVSTGAPSVQIIESGDTLLRELNASARRTLLSELAKAGVRIDLQADMSALSADVDFIVSAAGAAPHDWIAETGLSLEAGYIEVDKYLRSTNTPDVFAAGDCAHLSDAPRPKAGVFAVRQAPALFHNLRAQLTGGDFTSYAPQAAYLKLISLGRKSAVTDKWGIGLSGDWVWRWKDRIDQAFMKQFQEPGSMPSPKRPHDMALGAAELLEQQEQACGACGAKVAQTPLTDGLSVAGLTGPPEDAAIIKTDAGFEAFTTDHLRAFNPDPYTLARIAAVHALGDIWAMGGQPKTVLSQIILPPLAPAKQSAMIAEITAGANAVFAACDTQIAGGHSSNGAELTIGFSISASLQNPPITQSGAKPGNVLILTKPIGTGVLLAAEMRQLADGDHVQAALVSMCRLQDQAAALLAQHATAMTDVTGFGLAGHLLNILTASKVGAALDISSLPTLPGASSLSRDGVRSTLWPDNARHAAAFIDAEAETASLLFDPQTGGGLLAAIPEENLPDMLQQFESAGEPIWQIGRILDGPVRILTA
ncbi:MAG: selenide, water dikinase SelD [Pseudomonadota bacterium]